jgi:hypothetical protein
VASVDALSVQDMSALVSSIKEPLGGCMVLSGLTIDKAFARQDEKSFELIFEAKVGVTKALEQVIDIDSLDWLIGFTSVSGLFGSAGQTNYASANTALDGLLRSYSNAFSLVGRFARCDPQADFIAGQVSPLIIDSNAAMDLSHLGHFKVWARSLHQKTSVPTTFADLGIHHSAAVYMYCGWHPQIGVRTFLALRSPLRLDGGRGKAGSFSSLRTSSRAPHKFFVSDGKRPLD